jgi:hypothetical protein
VNGLLRRLTLASLGGVDHDTENFARGRLLIERLGERAVARLQLGEQAYVLDRDDSLVGEGLDQL